MGGLFSKGSSAPAMPQMPQQQMPDMSGILEAMMGMVGAIQASTEAMMQGMMSMQANQPQLPDIPEIDVPEIEREPEQDWESTQEKISNKIRGDFTAAELDRKGRLDTVLTSPLLDDEDAQVSSSVLAGD